MGARLKKFYSSRLVIIQLLKDIYLNLLKKLPHPFPTLEVNQNMIKLLTIGFFSGNI